MSRAAEAWFFDECGVRGNEGWVLISLCNYADDDGCAALSKRSLVAKTCMSEATVYRALTALRDAGVVEFVEGELGPVWWRSIPVNRRPRLVRLTEFLGSRFATPIGSGVSQGYQKPGSGVSRGYHDTPADQPLRDAIVDGVTDTRLRPLEADLDCIRCHGSGTLISPTPGPDGEPFEMPCPCTDPEYQPPLKVATKPPAGVGMPARRFDG